MTFKAVLFSIFGAFLLAAWMRATESHPGPATLPTTPVLVELFTSEGCSSCPPADKFLQKLDQQPIPGAEMIVLSEHVDYWNDIGWKDPYSAHFYSERQGAYAKRFDLEGVYTPQMVIDGVSEFVGSNVTAADKAIAEAMAHSKIPVHLNLISVGPRTVSAHMEVGALGPSFGVGEADVYIALALNRAESQVSSGENAGHKLEHVAVVRELRKIGALKFAHGFSRDVQSDTGPGGQERLIAIVQGRQQGRVLGVAQLLLNTK
jgi:hypothetical protein